MLSPGQKEQQQKTCSDKLLAAFKRHCCGSEANLEENGTCWPYRIEWETRREETVDFLVRPLWEEDEAAEEGKLGSE